MSTRTDIAKWISKNYGSETLLFNLQLTYPEIMVGGEKKENYSTYSQVKLSFNKAEQILRNPEWGLKNLNNPEQETDIRFELEGKTTAEQRFEVFRTYLELALWIVAERVSLAKGNKRNVKIALNNTTAGILPYQFGEDYDHKKGLILTAPVVPSSVKKKEGKAAAEKYLSALEQYQKHVQKLVREAQSLWQQKLTFTYAGRDKEIREGLDSADGYSSECTTGDEIYKRHMRDDEIAKFLGGLMRIFGAGQTEGPIAAETIVETATGKVEEERTTSQGTVVYEAERRKASMAEVLIAVARSSTNILVTAHLKDTDTHGAFNSNFDGYRDYTAISFREDVLADPLKDWEDYYTCYDRNNDYSQNLWWVFSHELLHVYPIYESEYRELEEEEEVYHTRTKEEYEEWCRNNPLRPGYAWPSYEEIMRDPLKRSKLNILMSDPGIKEESGAYEEFELRESPEEDVPSFADEQNPKFNRKGEFKGRFKDIDVEPSFTAYDLTDPAQVKWLRDWFEGRLKAIVEQIDTLSELRVRETESGEKIPVITQMEHILKGTLRELLSFKNWIPKLQTVDFNAQQIFTDSVERLIKVGLTLRESPKFYLIDHKSRYLSIWRIWQSIAAEFDLVDTFKKIAQQVAQHYVDYMKKDFKASLFAENKSDIQTWEQEFGINLSY